MTFTSDINATYVDGLAVDKADVRTLGPALDALAENVGKIFRSRLQAENAGQAGLPATYQNIITMEAGVLTVRQADAQADDPLFATHPYWGVILRLHPKNLETMYDDDFSNNTVLPSVDTIIQRSQTQTSIWFKLAGTPSPIDPVLNQQSQDGAWWHRAFSGEDVAAIADALQEQIEDVVLALSVDRPEGAAAGDDPVLIEDAAGDPLVAYRLEDGTLAANIRAGDMVPDDHIRLFTKEHEALLDVGRAAAGDGGVIAMDAEDKVVAGFTEDGLLAATLTALFNSAAGDRDGVHWDDDENPLMAYEADGTPVWPYLFDRAPAAGDDVLVVLSDMDGNPLWGIDLRTLQPVSFVDGNASGGGTLSRATPATTGNAWNAVEGPDGEILYLSDQWGGRVIGFEERDGLTLAQTGEVAVGMVAFGGGSIAVERPLPELSPYHIRDEALGLPVANRAAQAHAVSFMGQEDEAHRALPLIVAISAPQPSITEAEALEGSALREALKSQIEATKTALNRWGKYYYIDRIVLSLLEAAPATPQVTADFHYAAVAQSIATELGTIAEQGKPPAVVVSPGGGTRTDGSSPVILAESYLEREHVSLGFVVAAPSYAYEIKAGTVGTMTPDGAMMQSELQAIAVAERLANRPWYQPQLLSASLTGTTITAELSAMSDLVIDDPLEHGFMTTGGVNVTAVSVNGTTATITLDAAPAGAVDLYLAWGKTAPRADDYPINYCTLRDSWSQVSKLDPAFTHHRYALPSMVSVTTA